MAAVPGTSETVANGVAEEVEVEVEVEGGSGDELERIGAGNREAGEGGDDDAVMIWRCEMGSVFWSG